MYETALNVMRCVFIPSDHCFFPMQFSGIWTLRWSLRFIGILSQMIYEPNQYRRSLKFISYVLPFIFIHHDRLTSLTRNSGNQHVTVPSAASTCLSSNIVLERGCNTPFCKRHCCLAAVYHLWARAWLDGSLICGCRLYASCSLTLTFTLWKSVGQQRGQG